MNWFTQWVCESGYLKDKEMSDNELIAEFMGLHRLSTEHDNFFTDVETSPYKWHSIHLKYNTSWDHLMPVVEKIEEDLLLQVEMHTAYTNINGELDGAKYNQDSCFEAQSDTKLTVTYNAVVQFIKWYNNQKK